MNLGRRWMWRGAFGVCASASFLFGSGACGDDSSEFQPVDAGLFDSIPPTPPPYDGGAPSPDASVDTTGRFGEPALVANVGQSIDGPSWHVADQSLYFTVPGEAPSLRRLAADGGVVPVDLYDGGPPGPYGTANGGGAEVFITEPKGLVVLSPGIEDPDANAPPPAASLTRVPGPFDLLGDIAVERRPDAGARAVFVDTAGGFAYRYDPALGVSAFTQLITADAGGVRATGIALGPERTQLGFPGSNVIYIALSTGTSGAIVQLHQQGEDEQTKPTPSSFDPIRLDGIPPNGIAVDEEGNIFVAWAKGIDVFRGGLTPSRIGSASPGFHLPGGTGALTSLAFGGADRKTLFLTTSTGQIWAVPSLSPGILR